MRLKPPTVPAAASSAGGASVGPRMLPGTYTVRMTKDKEVYSMPLKVVPDSRATHSLADRRAQFNLAKKLSAMLGEMSVAVDRLNAVRLALDSRAGALPAGDPLIARLRSASSSVDALRKKIVATKEGGAITGEERLRENLADLYGSVNGYDGRPSQNAAGSNRSHRARAARRRSRFRRVAWSRDEWYQLGTYCKEA